jgi:hypothetical protein
MAEVRDVGNRRSVIVTSISAAGDTILPLEQLRNEGILDVVPRNSQPTHQPFGDIGRLSGLLGYPFGTHRTETSQESTVSDRTLVDAVSEYLSLLPPQEFKNEFIAYIDDVERENIDFERLTMYVSDRPKIKAALMKLFPELKAAWGPMPVTIPEGDEI